MNKKSAARRSPKAAGGAARKAPKMPGLHVSEPVPGYAVATLEEPLEDLIDAFPASDLADILEVSPKTLSRWKQKGETLTPQQSDRMARVEAILKQGERLFGSRENALRWLEDRVLYLDGRRPLDLIKTESGRAKVEEALGVIEWGMF